MAIKTGMFLDGNSERGLWFLVHTGTIAYNLPTIPNSIGIDWIPFWPIQILLGIRKENAKTYGIGFPFHGIRTTYRSLFFIT